MAADLGLGLSEGVEAVAMGVVAIAMVTVIVVGVVMVAEGVGALVPFCVALAAAAAMLVVAGTGFVLVVVVVFGHFAALAPFAFVILGAFMGRCGQFMFLRLQRLHGRHDDDGQVAALGKLIGNGF